MKGDKLLILVISIGMILLISSCSTGEAVKTKTGTKSKPLPSRPLIKCGDTITQSVTLTKDDPITQRRCSLNGLVIGADNVKLDCKNFPIRGSYSTMEGYQRGIYVSEKKGVTIQNCVISEFNGGISMVNGFRNKIYFNHIKKNQDFGLGIFNIDSAIDFGGNVIQNNLFEDNKLFSSTQPSAGFVEENIIAKNDFFGRWGIQALLIDFELCSENNGNFYANGINDAAQAVGPCGKSSKPFTLEGIKKRVADKDDDGFVNPKDNCPEDFNPDQIDTNGDGIGDACCRSSFGDCFGLKNIEINCEGEDCIDVVFVPWEDVSNLAEFETKIPEFISQVFYRLDEYLSPGISLPINYKEMFNFYLWKNDRLGSKDGTRIFKIPEGYENIMSSVDLTASFTFSRPFAAYPESFDVAGFASIPHKMFVSTINPDTFLHELSHALFTLSDIRECSGDFTTIDHYVKKVRDTNTFLTAATCKSAALENGFLPFKCRSIPNRCEIDYTKVWTYGCEREESCVMNRGETATYGEMASVRVAKVLNEFSNYDVVNPFIAPTKIKSAGSRITGSAIADAKALSIKYGMLTILKIRSREISFVKNKVVSGYHPHKECLGACLKVELQDSSGRTVEKFEVEDPRDIDDGDSLDEANLYLYYQIPFEKYNVKQIKITDPSTDISSSVEIGTTFDNFCKSNPLNYGCSEFNSYKVKK